MKETKSIKVNSIFNALYQVLSLIVPLITTPYISRVLGPGPNGEYAYYYSIVSYFVIFATFGFSDYGTKKIAELRDNKEEKTTHFFSILFSKLILGFICLSAYIVTIFLIWGNNTSAIKLLLIFSIYILSTIIDPVFFFQGEERFISICLKNLLLKITSTILIFIFVKQNTDLEIYALILAGSQILSILSLYLGIHKSDLVKLNLKSINLLKCIKEAFPFFVPTLAVSLFTYLNQTFLGILIPDANESGYFSQSLKIVTILSTLTSSISIIMLSRISYLRSTNNEKEINNKIKKMFQAFWAITLPIIFGLCAVTDVFIPIFLGEGYQKCILIIYLLSPTIIFSPLNTLYGNIYYRPSNKIRIQTIAIFIASLLNIILSFALIPLYASIGASIARIVAEFIQVPILVYCARKFISAKKTFIYSIKPLISSIVMFIVLLALKFSIVSIIKQKILLLFILILVGMIIYIIFGLIIKDSFIKENIYGLRKILKRTIKK